MSRTEPTQNHCTTCNTPLLNAYCGKHEPSRLVRLTNRFSMWRTKIRFMFLNPYTVDTDSPTWKEELDNIMEVEKEKQEQPNE